MPLKPYLKLYLVLVAAGLAVALVCYGVFQGLNSVREQAHLEALPAPLLSWLGEHPGIAAQLVAGQPVLGQSVAGEEWETWRIWAEPDLMLDPVARERLAYGQTLAHLQGDGVHWLYRLESGTILELSVRQPYRDLAEIQARLIGNMLKNGQLAFDSVTLAALGRRFGSSVMPLTSFAQVPGQGVLEHLVDQGSAFYQHDSQSPAQVFQRVEGTGPYQGQIFKLTLPAPFDPWGWPVLLLMFMLVAAALGLVVYLLLAELHQRLRNIENVVARIARGELDARVRGGKLSLVDRFGDAFNRMADHIQRLVGVQREMIHAVSHELRTPVARIRFGVQMLEDGDDVDSRNKQLAGIDSDIQELDELIDEILTYARLEQGGPLLSFQDVNLAQIVEQVAAEQRLTHPGLTIVEVFEGDVSRWAMTDAEPRYIHRAIQNLVGNATRYAQSEVRVSCQFESDTCRVDVEDDGSGIPETDWDKVFTAFARLDDSRTRKSGGYGLGLSIVRRILFWHGGQAFVGRSEALGGARFSLVWPRRQPDQDLLDEH